MWLLHGLLVWAARQSLACVSNKTTGQYGAVNSLFEELLWRAGMADMLAPRDSTAAPWLIMVSLGFGLSHLYGTPGGWTGVVATACFGLAMAALRFCCRGSILLCVAVHAIADLVLLGMLYV
ncbi:CPBP family intramembrane glutamic endopeptidase [Cellulomonas gelida]|uniref:CPBP family intramembrane glutamic endopeptidase n=1 Tax=Cellulomonas gelida TaxID=1712 RepID=UPI001143F4B3